MPTPAAHRKVIGAASLVVVALAHVPMLWIYSRSLLALPQYEYILALPVFAGILIYSRARYLGSLVPGSLLPSFGLFFVAASFLAAAVVFDSPWLGAISSLWALLAGCYCWGGSRFMRAALPAWCVLWLVVRLPMEYDTKLVQTLQSVAAAHGSVLLHLLGQPHILSGNVVETPHKVYAVEEACSGVQSLFAITACTVFFVLFSRMSWWRSLLLLAVGWWWVWAANVARVVLVAYLNSQFDIPIDTGWMHDVLGVGLFALTLGLIYSSGRFLWFLFPYGIFGRRDGIDTERLEPTAVDHEAAPTRFPSLAATPLSSVFLFLFYLALTTFLWLPQLRVPAIVASPDLLNGLSEKAVLESFNGWELIPYSYNREERRTDSQWGANSQAWRYRKGERVLVISVDYPFMGWHDLATCYDNNGWLLNAREQNPIAGSQSSPKLAAAPGVSLRMQKPVEKDFGFVLFQVFNARLDPMPVPETNVFKTLGTRIRSYRERLATMGASGADLNSQSQTFQVQLFIQDRAPLSEQEEQDLRQLYARFRDQLLVRLANAPPQ
ncbi:MAG: exosortase U [Pirellulales bacterium]